jgi:hypothetical protein
MTKRVILLVTSLGTDVAGETLPYQIDIAGTTVKGTLLGRVTSPYRKEVGQCADDAVVKLLTPDARFQIILEDLPKPAA